MRCRILHESRYRIRVHLCQTEMDSDQADILDSYLNQIKGVRSAAVYMRTADAVICHEGNRTEILSALSSFRYEEQPLPEHSARQLSAGYEEKLVLHIVKRCITRFLLPAPLRYLNAALKSVKYIIPGIRSLLGGKLEVSVLDALTIGVSLLRRDYDTAGDIMFLLGTSEILEEWTHKKSLDDLARSMSLNIDQVWLKTEDGTEVLVPAGEIRQGDLVVVRQGNVIPFDGIVTDGDMSVNQASMTGEALPVHKQTGAYVYAGTAVEDGQCTFRVAKTAGGSRYDAIVKMIEESEKLSSESENRAFRLADGLVPWCLGATAVTWLLTRNINRTLSVLMVDFSCALKLTIPISVLSAMREISDYSIRVKGGKFLETAAGTNTIIFDKTGTLTCSVPKVAKVVAFGGDDEKEMLRLAACLEEHYPHSIANAVVKAAKEQGLEHEEKHTEVNYVVAHGIASSIDGKKTVIGSRHFVFEDEGCTIPEGEEEKYRNIPEEYSHLFLAVGGELAAVICIEDPIRPEAADVIRRLREMGVDEIVMMTGDNEKTAAAAAGKVGVDLYRAEVLPEDKAVFIDHEHEAGKIVMMVGDGINDTPAMSRADVSAAISDGAAIAREIADITVAGDSIEGLCVLRQLSMKLMNRIRMNYFIIASFNSALILGGMLGMISPSAAAYAHNFSTMALSLRSMTNLMNQNEKAN